MSLTAQEIQLISDSGLFDSAWYAKKYPDVGIIDLDPLEHFLQIGIYIGRPPCPLFDGKHYLQQRVEAGHEGLPESPLLDYLEFGWKAGLNPHPLFSTRFYLEKNPDVAKAGLEPLGHYLRFGGKEGRTAHPAFDPAFYRENNLDVVDSGIDPLAHFASHGLAEGRSPNAFFHAADYLALNPDVARSPLQPAIHYAVYGFWEQRLTKRGSFACHTGGGPTPGYNSYAEWLSRNEAPEEIDSDYLGRQIASMKNPPVISVVTPVFNTKAEWLREAIDSVRNQIYPHWELCIADDASTAPHVRPILQEYQQKDSRIKVAYRDSTGHISQASNSALALATGDFVALLDHDDLLAPHALYHIAARLQSEPEAMILYSDEDKIAEDGTRTEPHFKSDWNPDLFFSQNYICHLCVLRRSLLEKIAGFRTGVEGSQDHDLLLRCLPHVSHEQILHIPRVLYHWRIHPQSTALSAGGKTYTTDAALKALEDYLDQHGPQGIRVEEGLVANTYRVRWPIPAAQPLVSLLIPTRDRRELTEAAVTSIREKSDYQNFEILILDNGSTDPSTLEYFKKIQKKDSRVRVLPYDRPFNYSAINNYGASQARGDLIALINNDIEVISPGWLSEMISHALRPEIGCVGAKLYYSNDTLQHAGVIVGLGGVAGHSHKYFLRGSIGYFRRLILIQNLSAVTAACLVIRKSVFHEVGGLDEKNLTVAFNDVDLCLKVREAGYRNLWTPYAELYHHESVSRGHEDTPEKVKRFQSEIHHMKEKWGDKLLWDPFYNENLTRDREDFSLR
jgi:glycosyltransferase involved in cell wall biosynthesis